MRITNKVMQNNALTNINKNKEIISTGMVSGIS